MDRTDVHSRPRLTAVFLGGDGARGKGFLPRRLIGVRFCRAPARKYRLPAAITVHCSGKSSGSQAAATGYDWRSNDRLCLRLGCAWHRRRPSTTLTEPNAADMKIAIATNDYSHVSGHAGQARHWLLYDSDTPSPEPLRIQLEKAQVFHHWDEEGSHPLDDVAVIVAGSAGDGFRRRMSKRGVAVLLTSERDAEQALSAVLKGAVLPEPGFDPSLLLCRLFDLFSKH